MIGGKQFPKVDKHQFRVLANESVPAFYIRKCLRQILRRWADGLANTDAWKHMFILGVSKNSSKCVLETCIKLSFEDLGYVSLSPR